MTWLERNWFASSSSPTGGETNTERRETISRIAGELLICPVMTTTLRFKRPDSETLPVAYSCTLGLLSESLSTRNTPRDKRARKSPLPNLLEEVNPPETYDCIVCISGKAAACVSRNLALSVAVRSLTERTSRPAKVKLPVILPVPKWLEAEEPRS